MSNVKDAILLQQWLKREWEKRRTIAVGLVVLGYFGLKLAVGVDFEEVSKKVSLWEYIGLGSFLCAVFLLWLWSRRPPKAKDDAIGIAVGVVCESKREQNRLRADFIQALRDEVQRGHHRQFDVLELSEYHAERLERSRKTTQYHRLTRSLLLVYGRCRIREHQGKPTYVLDLNVSVAHSPIARETSVALSNEMRMLFPQKTLFPSTEEVKGFTLTKEIVGHGARYTLGTASFLSGDPFTAFDFHYRLWREINAVLEKESHILPGYKLIRNGLPNKLVFEGLVIASHFYGKKSNGYLQEMDKYLKVVQEIDPRNYQAHLLRGIYYFLTGNIEEAKKEIRKAKNDKDASWQFSEAFLAAYEGDLEQAHKLYQRACRGITQPDIPLVVEIFIADVLKKEPDKFQLWYCLGMVNYFPKGDVVAAKADFSKFIKLAKECGMYETSVKFAREYLQKIENSDQ